MKGSRIYYYCYNDNQPTGGQKHTYRHVDILRDHGFDAFVFHPADNFRLTWFENNTRVIDFSQFQRDHDPECDYVVLPEDLGIRIWIFPGKKVIFNKNFFYGFRVFGFDEFVKYPYHDPDVVSAFTVSEHNKAHLEFAYPNLLVQRVFLEIRPDIFRWTPLACKKPQIAYILKGSDSLVSLFHLIQSRSRNGLNRGNLFNWVMLAGKSEREIAAILQESLLFVFTSGEEGLGRMPLEAMSCGCLVAAYGTGPLREIIPPAARFEHGDILGMAKFVERVMESFPDQLDQWNDIVQTCRRVAQSFSLEQQERSVLTAWETILRRRDVHLVPHQV